MWESNLGNVTCVCPVLTGSNSYGRTAYTNMFLLLSVRTPEQLKYFIIKIFFWGGGKSFKVRCVQSQAVTGTADQFNPWLEGDVMPLETFEMGRSPTKSRQEFQAFWKTYELFIDGDIKYISNFFKNLLIQRQPSPGCEVHFFKFSLF